MKTALQNFLETIGDSIKSLDCQLINKINALVDVEKECLIEAYEAGLTTSKHNLKINATDYFTRIYSDPNENSNARIDMQSGLSSGHIKKRKRKRIS